jgi:2-methylcitrate dehydratase PrpD
VKVYLKNGQVLDGRIDEPKGDPGNTLTRAEIQDKALRLAAFSRGASEAEMNSAIDLLFAIRSSKSVPFILPH